MNGLTRRKENRICQEIYLGDLRHTNYAPTRVGYNGANLGGRTLGSFHENAPRARTGKGFPNRINKSRVPWIILRIALLIAGIALCLWVYLGQFGIHP